jgi:uncharacterized protein (TIGR02145 family)
MNLENLIHKGKKAIVRTACAGVASLMLLTGCPPPITPVPQPSATHILTQEEDVKIIDVENASLTFSEQVNYSDGDIIVSDVSPSTPEGLLREVTGVSADKRTVYTETASLEDAIDNVTFATQKKLSRDIAINSGVSLIDFNFDGIITYADNISIGGSVDFNSDLVFEIGIQNHHLNKLLIKNVIEESSSVNFTAGSSLLGVDEKFSLLPHPYNLPSFTIYLPTVPPFPIVITPKLDVVAGIEGGISPLTVTATQSMNSELGLDYENGSWNIIKNLNFNPPTYSMDFANVVHLKASVGPKLDFLIYGAAGPYAEVNGYLNLQANTSGDSIELYGGLEAILGVNMKIFSKILFDFSTDVLDFNWLLKRWEKLTIPPPTPHATTLKDTRDSQVYDIVKIGNQWWMAENLNYDYPGESWYYNNNPSNGSIYGRLYTWNAARNSYPAGWHLPSDEEWKTLEMNLGMSSADASRPQYRGEFENVGGKLKSILYWNLPNTGATNETGFNALPGGIRYASGDFILLGLKNYLWTSTEDNSTNATIRILEYNRNSIYRGPNFPKANGYSVRYVEDQN